MSSDKVEGPTAFQLMILRALSLKHHSMVYGGTASAKKVQKRRAKNKVARQSRRINRPA